MSDIVHTSWHAKSRFGSKAGIIVDPGHPVTAQIMRHGGVVATIALPVDTGGRRREIVSFEVTVRFEPETAASAEIADATDSAADCTVVLEQVGNLRSVAKVGDHILAFADQEVFRSGWASCHGDDMDASVSLSIGGIAQLDYLLARPEIRARLGLAPPRGTDVATARNLLADSLTRIHGDAPDELMDCAARAAEVLNEMAAFGAAGRRLEEDMKADRLRQQLDVTAVGRESANLAVEPYLDKTPGLEPPAYREWLDRLCGQSIEVTGDPLFNIAPGVYDLQMRDGSTVRAEVGVVSGIGPWWIAIPHKKRDTPSDDWREVVGAVQVTAMAEIHGPPDPTDGTDGGTGSRQTAARARMANRSDATREPGDVGWHLDVLHEDGDHRIVADTSKPDGVLLMSQSRCVGDDSWWTDIEDSMELPRTAADRLIDALTPVSTLSEADFELEAKLLTRTQAISVEDGLVRVGRMLERWRDVVDQLGTDPTGSAVERSKRESRLTSERDSVIIELFRLVAP